MLVAKFDPVAYSLCLDKVDRLRVCENKVKKGVISPIVG